jgi:hypothetical protein
MSHIIIDRRKNDKGKSTDNRGKFFRRVKTQVKDAIKDVIGDGSVKDIIDNKEKKVKIPGKGLSKPTFQHDQEGGIKDYILPGNKKFSQGDRVPRPNDSSGGARRKGSDSGDGEDEFSFHLTKEEFLDLFFEDLQLPNMTKRNIAKTTEFVNRRAGFSVDGPPSRLNILRSMRQAKGRLFALRSPKKKLIRELELLLYEIELKLSIATDAEELRALNEQKEEISTKLAAAKRKHKAIPFIDEIDLRYNRWEKVPIPITRAVMFGIMDVSGSMGETEKDIAKRFFMLMLLFLSRNYDIVDIVWIRHTHEAKEVDEKEFFYSKETGGTVVSTALELMRDIIHERYPTQTWNIYGVQISDGDNWASDTPRAIEILGNSILPSSQYFAYVEVEKGYNPALARARRGSDLWPHYESLKHVNSNMETAVVGDIDQIFPVFHKLFEKKQ